MVMASNCWCYVGTLRLSASSAVSARNLVSGTTEQLVGGFNFQSVSEAFDVNKIVITEAGSAVSADITNINLKLAVNKSVQLLPA